MLWTASALSVMLRVADCVASTGSSTDTATASMRRSPPSVAACSAHSVLKYPVMAAPPTDMENSELFSPKTVQTIL